MFCPKTLAGASSPLSAELMSAEKKRSQEEGEPHRRQVFHGEPRHDLFRVLQARHQHRADHSERHRDQADHQIERAAEVGGPLRDALALRTEGPLHEVLAGKVAESDQQPGLHEEEPFEQAPGRQEPGPALGQGVEHGGDPAGFSEDDRQQTRRSPRSGPAPGRKSVRVTPHMPPRNRVDEDDGGGDEDAGDERETRHRGKHRPHRQQLRSHPADVGRNDRERGQDFGRPAEPAAEEIRNP